MKRIGRYTIKGRLGRGGMSSVYKAHAPVTGRTVALKVLFPRDEIFEELVGEERLRQIFIEEARIMGEITHDHIAKIIDCEDGGRSPFIVLEYFAHSIGSLIGERYQLEQPSRVISVNKAYQYIRQTLLGLERLHFAGIVHRDIKPYNLMLTNDDRVKIIDFGLSRVRGEEKMAIPGMQVGSPYYAAPEQEKNPKETNERADLFSVGIMAHRLVTGRLVNVRQSAPEAPSTHNEELNRDWDDFLLTSIAVDPACRFHSAHQMRRKLEDIYQSWARQSENRCTFIASDSAGPSLAPQSLRAAPQFLRPEMVTKKFNLDELMRPRVYAPHRFEYIDRNLLRCLDTNLLWYRDGAGFPLPWNKAHEYIAYLNDKRWLGYDHWRLPTLEELFSLLRPPTVLRDFCLETYFAPDIHWLWSCDTRSKKKAWSIDLLESYVEELDKDGMASVCPVVSPKTA